MIYEAIQNGQQVVTDAPADGVIKYTVSFNTSGTEEEIASQSIPKGGNATSPEPTVIPDGKEFGGWYLSGSAFNFATPITSAITLIAKWNTPLTVGQEVTVGDEKFFVLGENGDTVTLLAKYNLNRAGTAQLNANYNDTNGNEGTGRKFSNNAYWSSDFTSSPFDLQSGELKTYALADNNTWTVGSTEVKNAIRVASEYGIAKGGTGRLMTYQEAYNIQQNGTARMKNILWGKQGSGTGEVTEYSGENKVGGSSGNGYLYWWLGSAHNGNYVSLVNGRTNTLDISSYGSTDYGVRPVIIVSKSNIQ